MSAFKAFAALVLLSAFSTLSSFSAHGTPIVLTAKRQSSNIISVDNDPIFDDRSTLLSATQCSILTTLTSGAKNFGEFSDKTTNGFFRGAMPSAFGDCGDCFLLSKAGVEITVVAVDVNPDFSVSVGPGAFRAIGGIDGDPQASLANVNFRLTECSTSFTDAPPVV